MTKILVVEDDYELNQTLCYALTQEGYAVSAAVSIKEAEEICGDTTPDLALLDVNLPDGEGYRLCRRLKEKGEIPVLFLTARDLESDMLKGYEMGAEDYVTKPFSLSVLLKKIQVIIRRTGETAGGEEGLARKRRQVFDDGWLRIDFDAARAYVDGAECMVTPTEFRMLRLFTEHVGQLLTYSVLMDRLWDSKGQFVDRHTLTVNVNRLRSKIEDREHKYISNVYGMGYQWLKES